MLGDILRPFGAGLDACIIPDPEAFGLEALNDRKNTGRILVGIADKNIRFAAFIGPVRHILTLQTHNF